MCTFVAVLGRPTNWGKFGTECGVELLAAGSGSGVLHIPPAKTAWSCCCAESPDSWFNGALPALQQPSATVHEVPTSFFLFSRSVVLLTSVYQRCPEKIKTFKHVTESF